MKKKTWWIVDAVLLCAVAVIAYQKFLSGPIKIDCNLGSEPKRILSIIASRSDTFSQKGWQLVFVFNLIPDSGQIETIEKIDRLFKKKISLHVLFAIGYDPSDSFSFAHSTIKKKVFCPSIDGNDPGFFFFLMNNRTIEYLDRTIALSQINLLLNQRLKDDTSVNTAISGEKLVGIVKRKIKDSPVTLWDVGSGKAVILDGELRKRKIHFFHAVCSPCELRNLAISMRSLSADELIVFSVLANSQEIKKLKAELLIEARILIDQEDIFGLASFYLGVKKNPVEVDPLEGA